MEKLVFIPFMMIIALIALVPSGQKELKVKVKHSHHKIVIKSPSEKV